MANPRTAERSTYTPLDFLQWYESGTLVISPKFQRRAVWNRAAQSFLIDTLLLGLPVPPLYLRVVQSDDNRYVVREVIDGQQRLSAVIDFMSDKYALARNIESPCVGKRYSELSRDERDKIRNYSFICEVFHGVDDSDILRIFARLNMYSVKLNSQELRNGKYFGPFKQSAYDLALQHLEFWRQNRIFSETYIARMQEVELTSELMILEMEGLQDKKKSIDSFYTRFDEEFPREEEVEGRFRTTIDYINLSLEDTLRSSEFRRTPLFYSLFGAYYHRLYGVPRFPAETPASGRISRSDLERLDEAVRTLSEIVNLAKDEDEEIPDVYESFVRSCLRQTDNIRPRQIRLETIYQTAFG